MDTTIVHCKLTICQSYGIADRVASLVTALGEMDNHAQKYGFTLDFLGVDSDTFVRPRFRGPSDRVADLGKSIRKAFPVPKWEVDWNC